MTSRRVTPLVGWSLGLDAVFFLLMIVFAALVGSGQHGGATFFANPLLSATMVLAAASAIIGGVLAVIALFRPNERTVALVFPIGLGLFVLAYALVELIARD